MLECGHATREIGLIYSKGLSPHGTSTLYCYADSAHPLPRSQGCSIVMMNGTVISCTSKKNTTTTSSACHDVLIEFWIVGNTTAGFSNIMSETGMHPEAPTQVYQNSDAAIQIEMKGSSLGSHSRHIARKELTSRNKIEVGGIMPVCKRTSMMLADIGTKALPDAQF